MKRIACLATLIVLASACGPDGTERGALIRPHLSPVNFGNLAYLPDDPIDPGCMQHAPCQWSLLLQSYGTDPVEVTQTCLLGDSRNAFVVEGPKPTTIEADHDAVVRFTYQPSSASNDVDNVALVVQSTAENFPTLIVPLCGRVLDPADVADASAIECKSPVSVDPGVRDDSLCP